MECDQQTLYLFITSIFTGFMWILSEIIGSSKCKPNGVFEFCINGFCVELQYESCDNHDENVNVDVDETSFLIARKPPQVSCI